MGQKIPERYHPLRELTTAFFCSRPGWTYRFRVLVVASGFDAAGGEGVPERMEANSGQAQRIQQPGEVVAVAAGLNAP